MQMTPAHRDALHEVLTWRRDVRHFRTDPVPEPVMDRLRAAMDLAPSVGNSRPWRVLRVQSPSLRAHIASNFDIANDEAAKGYDAEAQARYRALKLAGLRDAPEHLAVFTARNPVEGHGLGRQTMPEMLAYSTVTAIHTLWLAARAENIGVGWVSILDPGAVGPALGAPADWDLTGYLCLGWPVSDDDTPLLHRAGWQDNTPTDWRVV